MARIEGQRLYFRREAPPDNRLDQRGVPSSKGENVTRPEQVARQLGLRVEGLAQFIRQTMYDDFPYGERPYKDDLPYLRIWGSRGFRHEGDRFHIMTLDDPIQGVVGGLGGQNRTELHTAIAQPGLTEVSYPDNDYSGLASLKFGFTVTTRVDLNWHLDEPTLQDAVDYIQGMRDQGKNIDETPGLIFNTSYFVDKEGHFIKISTFPRRIPDNRPDIFGIDDAPWKQVQSPITAWDLALLPGAVNLVDRKVKKLAEFPHA